jgi:structural maintenance of chromosome 3 (chondroitin sulfate proteoglycan 6)
LLLELSDSPYLLSFKSIEAEIAEKRQQQSLLALNKQEMDEEMQDLTRSKTQVECLVADLRSAEVSNDGAAEQLQNQLQDISQRISEKEVELMEIEPEWASARQQEMDERRKYAEMLVFAHGTDCSVGSKTLIRDAFLRREIDSLGKFRENQSSTLNNLQLEQDQTTSKQQELVHREEELQTKLHERKERLGHFDQEISSLKQQHADLSEQRK